MTRQTPFSLIGKVNEYNVNTAAELMTQANLDWRVSLEDIQTIGGLEINSKYATVKTTVDGEQSVLSVVGGRYQVIQNAEIFSCLDGIVGTGETRYAAAGELGGGKVVWTVLELPDTVSVGGDQHGGYIVARSSHDGSTPFQMTPVLNRLSCTNQINLTMFNGKSKNKYYSIRHTTNNSVDVASVRAALGIIRQDISNYVDVSSWLRSISFDTNEFKLFIEKVYALPTKVEFAPVDMLNAAEKRMKTAVQKNRERAMLVWNNETGTQEEIFGTKFGAFQAIVEVADHFSKSADRQAEKTLLGKDTTVKAKALQLLGV